MSRSPNRNLVKAKPIDQNLLRKLPDFHKPRDFVRASKQSVDEFYDSNTVVQNAESSPPETLTADEKNKLASKIIRAEMMGNMELARKLRQQISKSEAVEPKPSIKSQSHEVIEHPASSRESESILLTKIDPRSGLMYPVKNRKEAEGDKNDPSKSKKKRRNAEDYSIKDLLEMEKFTSAEDQLAMFGATSSKVLSSEKTDDSFTVDDLVESKMEKKKKTRDDQTKNIDFDKAVKEHQRLEQTLDSCTFCIDSRKLQRHLIVALGLKTYVSVPPTAPLVPLQCSIVAMAHVSSCLQMDEDVFDEMKIWRKGLVAMYRERDLDVVFIETVKNVQHQPHTHIECYPVPLEVGDTAPMFFKKAILECEEEWAQNKKIIELNKKELRKSIPKGFSYFAVDFGLQPGYAHVIENEAKFPAFFGQEVIGGMLDLDQKLWRRPAMQSLKEQTKRVDLLKESWDPFDWTERVKARLKNE